MSLLRSSCRHCGRDYSPEEQAARQQAKKDNISYSRYIAKQRGTPLGRKPKFTTQQRLEIFKLHEQGNSMRSLAKMYSVSTTAIRFALRGIK